VTVISIARFAEFGLVLLLFFGFDCCVPEVEAAVCVVGAGL
jgi:hypothetical protein